MAAGNNWPFERASDDEIGLAVTGRWTNYQVSFTWMSDIEALHLACAFDMKVPEQRLPQVQQLIAMINEQLWIGHFDVWMQNGMVMFRHALVLAGGVTASGRQCEAVLGTALEFLRALFPGLSVCDLGRQVAARGDGRRHVRDRRRSVTAGFAVACAIFPASSFCSAPARWAARCSKAGCGSGSIRKMSR